MKENKEKRREEKGEREANQFTPHMAATARAGEV